uniref:Si:ch73-215d9.1 n=1 Tax=Astyanax mexicanus TaxID=7994 RepID=A0A8B9H2J6_ASTMX
RDTPTNFKSRIGLSDVVAGQCWQGATYSETVVSPELRSSSIMRVPEVLSLTQCAAACCDLPGCDLAWFFERRCYVLSCQHKENCQPKKRPGTDSLLAFLQRGPPQTLVLQSLVRGEPYPSHWRPLPRHRGPEDPLKDLALLGGIPDLENSPVDYPDSYRTSEDGGRGDDLSEEKTSSKVEHRESPGLPDWPALQESDGFNVSETEGGRRKPSQPDAAEGSRVAPSSPSTVTDGRTTSNSPPLPSLRPSESPLPTILVRFPSTGEVTLPENTIELTASVSPETETETPYTYEWSLVSSPSEQQAEMEGKHSRTVKISDLSAGVYVVRVSVKGKEAYGESVGNFTVYPEERRNIPPKSVALPKHQDVSLSDGSIIFINGSQSSDDTGVVGYLWEQVDGPLWKSEAPMDTPVLRLQNITAGEYTFRLTVTDPEGLTDSSTATLTVSSPKDNPPVARAGSDQVITLPLNHLTLWANQSTDDLAITGYLWSLQSSSSAKAATMRGIRSLALQLSELQEGQYTFLLTVTDSSSQQDSDTVVVTVLPENRAPVAVAGPDRQLLLPTSSVMLNGTDSSDDQAITNYQWEILSGPPGSKIKDADKAVAMVTGLRAGSHKIKLTVQDQQGEADSAVITVTVTEAKSLPLIAHASGSHTLTLPNNSLVLRGSASNCGSVNVSYLWVRDEQSPAAGVIYSVLHDVKCVGVYLREREEVELELQVAVAQVSQQQKDTVVRQLAALLHVMDTDIALKGLHGQSDISTVFRFSVQGPDGTIPGPKLARILRFQLLKEKTDFLLFKVLRVDTVMCLLLCSGRGQCDPVSRSCSCDPLWMENPFRRFLDDNESNCGEFFTPVFFPPCRGRRTKVRKKTKYTILDNMDEQERMELRPKYNIKHRSTKHNSSLMMSESEFDSEQDTVFSYERTDRARNRVNGAITNGDAYSLSSSPWTNS